MLDASVLSPAALFYHSKTSFCLGDATVQVHDDEGNDKGTKCRQDFEHPERRLQMPELYF